MSNTNDSDDPTSTDTSQDLRVMNSIPDPDLHDYQTVDQTHLLSIGGCTAYELTVKCQNKDCSQEASPILTQGDLPVTNEEEENLAYEIYRWFHANSDDIPPSTECSAFYIAPFMMIPDADKGTVVLNSRILLLVAALLGKRDGIQDRTPTQKVDVLTTAKRYADNIVQDLKER